VILEYAALRNGKPVSQARASTMVAKVPPIEWKVPANVEFTLYGTPGYNKYTWTVGGLKRATGRRLDYEFAEYGASTIECLCEEPAGGPEGTFLRITYEVTVTKR
jgi:hypothetical protein